MSDLNLGNFERIRVGSNTMNFNASSLTKNKMNFQQDYIELDYSNIDYSNTKINSDVLNRVAILAESDSQINTNAVFSEFSDFQNVMMADMCLLELLWENSGDDISGKTIGELYIESLGSDSQVLDYEKLVFTGDDWLKMANSENWGEYRSKALGKLVRYGFKDLKIKDFHQGKDGLMHLCLRIKKVI